jgi:hypothetical protein
LFKESILQKLQSKWRKNISGGNIEVLDQVYTLKVTDNKRKLIYNENNELISTSEYIINSNKEIINK